MNYSKQSDHPSKSVTNPPPSIAGDAQPELSVMLARQPIVDGNGTLTAFELLFRHTDGRSFLPNLGEVSDFDATTRVLLNVFAELGLQAVLGEYQGFINADTRFLLSEVPELLPADKVTIEILESVDITPEVLQRIIFLKQRGLHFALDNYMHKVDRYVDLIPLIDVVKIEVSGLAQKDLFAASRHFSGKKLLAKKVEDKAIVENCKLLGFDLFQGYYFAKPEIVSGKRTSPEKLALLHILRLAMADSETHLLEDELKRHGDLTYNLLRLVNSVAYSAVRTISSIQHALTILGRKQLISWLQLLLYADEHTGIRASPLLQTAAMRGKTMELLAQRMQPENKDLQETALMTGLFSLIDAILGIPKSELIKQLHLDEKIEAALLTHTGILGSLLSLVEHLEAGGEDWELIQLEMEALHLTIADSTQAQLEALRWSNQLGMKRK